MLSSDRIDEPLTPSCGRACICGQLGCLQVFKAANDESGLNDSLAVHKLPLENPASVDHVRGVFLADALERSEVQPALQFLEHRLVARGFVLQGLLSREDILCSFHDGFLRTRREQLHHVVLIMADRWQLLAVRRHQEQAHLMRQLHLERPVGTG